MCALIQARPAACGFSYLFIGYPYGNTFGSALASPSVSIYTFGLLISFTIQLQRKFAVLHTFSYNIKPCWPLAKFRITIHNKKIASGRRKTNSKYSSAIKYIAYGKPQGKFSILTIPHAFVKNKWKTVIWIFIVYHSRLF